MSNETVWIKQFPKIKAKMNIVFITGFLITILAILMTFLSEEKYSIQAILFMIAFFCFGIVYALMSTTVTINEVLEDE